MIIVLPGSGDLIDPELLDDEKTLYISYRASRVFRRHIAVSDLGYVRELPRHVSIRGFENPSYTYVAAQKQAVKIEPFLTDDRLIIIVDPGTGFDNGMAQYLLHHTLRLGKKALFIVIAPEPGRSLQATRFYAFLKLLSLYMFHANEPGDHRLGAFIVGRDTAPPVVSALASIIEDTGSHDTVIDACDGIATVWFRKYIIPIDEYTTALRIYNSVIKAQRIINNGKAVLISIDTLLDKAPAGFWEYARKNKTALNRIMYTFRRMKEAREEAERVLREYMDTFIKGAGYTEPLIDTAVGFLEVVIRYMFPEEILARLSPVLREKLSERIETYKEGKGLTELFATGVKPARLFIFHDTALAKVLPETSDESIDYIGYSGRHDMYFVAPAPLPLHPALRETYEVFIAYESMYMDRIDVLHETLYVEPIEMPGKTIDTRWWMKQPLITPRGLIEAVKRGRIGAKEATVFLEEIRAGKWVDAITGAATQ